MHSSRRDGALLITATLAVVIAVYAIPIWNYVENSIGPDVVASGDLYQQGWAFDNASTGTSLSTDYIAEYMRRAVMPLGFVAAVDFATTWFAPLKVFQLTSLLAAFGSISLIFLCTLAISTPLVAICSVVIAISIDPILDLASSGLPRSLGGTIICLGMLGVLSRKIALTLLAALLASLFYYSSMALILVFAAMQLADDRTRQAPASRVTRRQIAIPTSLIMLAVLIAIFSVQRGGAYGPLVRAGDPIWPEADYGGRFHEDEVFGYRQLGQDAYSVAAWAMIGVDRIKPFFNMPLHVREALPIIAFCAIGAWNIRAAIRGNATSRALLIIASSAVLVYILAYAALPYLYVPGRFLYLVASPLAAIALPYTAWAAFRWKRTSCLVATALVAALLGGVPEQRAPIGPDRKELFAFLSSLPTTTVIAGWPRSVVEEIPLMARRRIVVGEEMSLAWHRDYMKEMRQRTSDVLSAWLSIDAPPWIRLQRDYGATHLVIDKARILGKLSYFRPYDRFTEDALSKLPVQHRLQAEPALPSRSEIAFENATFKVWALPKRPPFGISLDETTTSTGLAKLAPHRQQIGPCSRPDC